MKRIALPKSVKVSDRKDSVWAVRPGPGPHPKKHCTPLLMLLRDVLKLAKTAREVKRILASRLVQVDGVVRTDPAFPVGLMDVISFPTLEKHYRIVVDWKGRIVPAEVKKDQASQKLVKVIRKHITKGGKFNLAFHDGRNMMGDNNVRVGDSVLIELPKAKLKKHLKLEKGSRCLVMEGKHVGSIVELKEIEARQAGKPSEAIVKGKEGEFVTVARYLFVVGDEYKVSK